MTDENWKHIKKHLFKLTGVIIGYENGGNGFGSLIVMKGSNKYAFSIHEDRYKELKQIPVGKKITFWFKIICKEYNDKWFTNLSIVKHELFIKRVFTPEDIKKEAKLNFQNDDFLKG